MDDRNCIASASFQLYPIINSMNPDSVIVDINHVSCFGTYDGSVELATLLEQLLMDYTTGPSGYTGSGDYISSLYAGSYAVVIEDVLMVVQLLPMLKLNSQSNLSIQHIML